MELTLFWFAPDKLNLYGDRGNIIVLKERCKRRGITLQVEEIKSTKGASLTGADLLFIGGGSDREQHLVTQDLMASKQEFKAAIEDGVAALTICGGYQFLGNYYELLSGEQLKGLEILDFYTVAKPTRLVGNVAIESDTMGTLVGFENHGGRTYHDYEPLGVVKHGYGNNDTDKKEGLLYKNLMGTYLHGPVLPKNPTMADALLLRALERKYGLTELEPLDDTIERNAKEDLLKKIR